MNAELEENIRQGLNSMIKDHQNKTVRTRLCQVTEINEDNETVDCQPLDDGPPLYAVRLQAVAAKGQAGFVGMPEVDSYVVVSTIDGDQNSTYVSLATTFKWMRLRFSDEAELRIEANKKVYLNGAELSFNGDLNGGLALTAKIAERLARVENAIDSLTSSFNQHTHGAGLLICSAAPGPVTGASAPPTAVVIKLEPKTNQEYISNPKIKHG